DYVKYTDQYQTRSHINFDTGAITIETIATTDPALNEVLIAGPKDYVKYTDQYQTRSHINFDTGAITIETIATTDPA
ncbi:murein transglycosylase domain-containing protein, partial [Enterobacter hormaechei]|uniref:murein transglycosylase domain-containing protein n=1 Tax=Enterobacter hormaechei TaxID=158836 RepID=UPI001F0AF25F